MSTKAVMGTTASGRRRNRSWPEPLKPIGVILLPVASTIRPLTLVALFLHERGRFSMNRYGALPGTTDKPLGPPSKPMSPEQTMPQRSPASAAPATSGYAADLTRLCP